MKKGAKNTNNIIPFMKTIPISEMGDNAFDLYRVNFKAHLMIFLNKHIDGMGMRQKEVGSVLGITQAQVSLLKNMRVSEFTIDRLIEVAFAAGYTFEMQPHKISGHAKN